MGGQGRTFSFEHHKLTAVERLVLLVAFLLESRFLVFFLFLFETSVDVLHAFSDFLRLFFDLFSVKIPSVAYFVDVGDVVPGE